MQVHHAPEPPACHLVCIRHNERIRCVCLGDVTSITSYRATNRPVMPRIVVWRLWSPTPQTPRRATSLSGATYSLKSPFVCQETIAISVVSTFSSGRAMSCRDSPNQLPPIASASHLAPPAMNWSRMTALTIPLRPPGSRLWSNHGLMAGWLHSSQDVRSHEACTPWPRVLGRLQLKRAIREAITLLL